MQKFYTRVLSTLAFSAALIGANAQTAISRTDIKTTTRSSVKLVKPKYGQHKQVEATLVTLNTYVAGTTMDLSFRLNLSNIDEEYGDSLSITLPAGFTPVSSPANPLYVAADPGAEPEALNGISGQTITWGDNDDEYGGIMPGEDVEFVVRVTVAGGLSGEKSGTFFVSGDTYGANGPAGDFSGTFTISDVAAAPDLMLIGVAPYVDYATPLKHAAETPLYAVAINNGGDYSGGADCQFYAFPGTFNDSKPVAGPVANGAFAIVESKPFKPASAGLYKLNFNATFPADADNTDNIDSASFVVSPNFFAALPDDTTGSNSLGLTTLGGLGTRIELIAADTLKNVNAWFKVPAAGTSVRAAVYNFDATAGTVGTLVANSSTISVTAPSYKDFAFNQVLPAGSYIVAIEQMSTSNMGLGASLNNYVQNYSWASLDGVTYQSLEGFPAGFHRTFYIKSFFGAAGTVGINPTSALEAAAIFPNPSAGVITISGIEAATVSVMDNLGRVVAQTEISAANSTISLDNLVAGNYIVKLENKSGVSYKQITLAK
ncbi:MAG: T9SS type A sorting domain-containing protein [Bacteroidota bacterium]